MARRSMKYNPAFLTEDELIRSFVARKTDLDLIIQVIRENVTGANQHVLVIGPRGSGKTMLLLRIAYAVRKDPELSQHWYPLIFAEESYEVGSVGEFWLEALFHLGRQTQDPQWIRTYEELKKIEDDKTLRDRALAQIMDFADKEGKRILLLVENLNMLFGDQMKDDDAWSLRHTLLNEPRIMLLGSAVSRFVEMENSDKAMYDLFKPHELEPLNEAECRDVWINITGSEPKDDRIRPIQILTGGNPRLLTIISTFGAKLSFRELMEDLMHLVDDHTEYFKSHLDNLPPIERKVYLALADLWTQSTAREIAAVARLATSKTSALLNRLVGRGAVLVAREDKRSKWYQTAERMYNIYHLMRRRGAPSSRVKGLVRFMIDFYGEEELVDMTQRLVEEACRLAPELCKDHYLAYESILLSVKSKEIRNRILDATPKTFFETENAPTSLRTFLKMTEQKSLFHARTASAHGYRDEFKKIEEFIANVTVDLNIDSLNIQTITGKESIFDVIEHLKSSVDHEHVTSLESIFLGTMLREAAQYGEAENIFRKAIDIDSKSYLAWVQLGNLLRKDLKRYDEAEQAYRKAIEIKPDYAWAWVQLGQLLHEELKRYDEAEQAYRKAIEIKPDYAWAWVQLGQLLHEELKRYDEAEQAYRKAIEIKPDYEGIKAQLLDLLNYDVEFHNETEQICRKMFEASEEGVNSLAWGQLGSLYQELKRYDEAEQAYRKAIEIKPDYAWALTQLGNLLRKELKRYDEAEQAYRKAIEIKPDYAWAWGQLGSLYQELKHYDEAEQAYRKAVENSYEIKVLHNFALAQLGGFYEEIGKYKEAEETYLKAISLTSDSSAGWSALIKLILEHDITPDRAMEVAKDALVRNPDNPTFLNSFAWRFYKHGNLTHLREAEKWAQEALTIEPDSANIHHTIACILCSLDKGAEALVHAQKYISDTALVEEHTDDTIELFLGLAAVGYAREAKEMLQKSLAEKSIEPLIVGLSLYIGENVKAAAEVMEVADDVVKRIKDRKEKLKKSK